jgi:hypothetical protein
MTQESAEEGEIAGPWIPNIFLNSTVQKEDSSLHQNVATCIEY